MTQTLADFLLARIAEDEELGGVWSEMSVTGEDRTVSAVERADVQRCWDAYENRIKAECEAKRRIAELRPSEDEWRYEDGPGSEYCVENPAWTIWVDVLKLLALPYAEHADYRPEWRP